MHLRIMKSSKSAIEVHIENIIKGQRDLWIGYKKWLSYIHMLLKKLEQTASLSIIEGDSFIRFKSNSDNGGFNSLFFVYEIGHVFPTLTWRHIVGTGYRFNYVLLKKTASCLPAFSFSLDHQITLLYWGERVPFLSTVYLKNLNLRNFVLRADSPSSVEVSAANIVWPKSAHPFTNKELERLVPYYIFNSLTPPILDSVSEVWSESPLVLVGNKKIRLLTLHKTLCTIDMKNAKTFTDKNIVNVKATLIDRNFTIKHVYLNILEEYFNELIERKKEFPCEVIFVKDIRVGYNSTMSEQKPYVRYMVYPFESIKLFGEESYGPLLSVVSLVLREYYLRSDDPFLFTINPEEFKRCLVKILGSFSYSHIDELGLKLIESKKGLYTLASLLKVYASDGPMLSYLHPALLECFVSDPKCHFSKNYLVGLQRIVSKYCQESKPFGIVSNISLIQKLFEEELGLVPSYNEAKRLILPLYNLVKVCIPLSKALCMQFGGRVL